MKIVIFGGTTEGRLLSEQLAKAGASVTVSVASDYGAEEQGAAEGISIECGPKDIDAICSMINDADLVIDATHPYAVLVTDNIRKASEKTGKEYIRLLRERSESDDADLIYVSDPAAAAEAAKASGGNVLLTTGSKDLIKYAKVLDPEHMFPRVLPLTQSILSCEEAGVPHRNIIAIQGPFSEELNKAVINEFEINVMITKDSGATGGFPEKIHAARECGIPVIVIARPEEEGLGFDEIVNMCMEKMR